MRTVIGLAAVLMLGAAPPGGSASAGERMFDRMKTLTGDWEGTFEWSEGRTGSGTLGVSYSLTGGGSALIENLIMGGVPTMTTVYHLDGPDLRMTHYCAARNQPRLKAVRFDETQGIAEFALVDVTNVGPKNAGHVQGFFIQLLDADHLTLRFTFAGGSARGVENIVVKRVRRS
ncbi:MAG: hypothetical protein ACXWLL_06415 [Myxococcaceae bacterium]